MPKPPYTGDWPATSRAQRQAEPECAWCGTTVDLCADHLVAGKPQYGTRTLCRPCNSRRAAGSNGPPTP